MPKPSTDKVQKTASISKAKPAKKNIKNKTTIRKVSTETVEEKTIKFERGSPVLSPLSSPVVASTPKSKDSGKPRWKRISVDTDSNVKDSRKLSDEGNTTMEADHLRSSSGSSSGHSLAKAGRLSPSAAAPPLNDSLEEDERPLVIERTEDDLEEEARAVASITGFGPSPEAKSEPELLSPGENEKPKLCEHDSLGDPSLEPVESLFPHRQTGAVGVKLGADVTVLKDEENIMVEQVTDDFPLIGDVDVPKPEPKDYKVQPMGFATATSRPTATASHSHVHLSSQSVKEEPAMLPAQQIVKEEVAPPPPAVLPPVSSWLPNSTASTQPTSSISGGKVGD